MALITFIWRVYYLYTFISIDTKTTIKTYRKTDNFYLLFVDFIVSDVKYQCNGNIN